MAEGDTCIVVDDRPRHLRSVKAKIEGAGASPEVALPDQFKRRFERLKRDPSGVRGLLFDNHLDDWENLASLGHAEIDTDDGTTAGYRIAAEIVIPAIERGDVPRLPIGIMSAHDVDQVRDEYEATGPDRYENIFFFKKSEVEKLEGESAGFFQALARSSEEFLSDIGARDRVYLAVANEFQKSFDLTDDEMSAVFALYGKPEYHHRVSRGTLSQDSRAWHGMSLVLLRIQSLLMNLYRQAPDPMKLGRLWLKSNRLGLSEGTPLEALTSGRIDRALQVVDELSISVDAPRVHDRS